MNVEIKYKIEHRNVRYPRLEFKGLQLLVILPLEMRDPYEVIEKRKKWIQKKWNIIQEAIKKVSTLKDFMIFGETYMIERNRAETPMIDHTSKKILLNPENPKHRKIILKNLKNLLRMKIKPIIEEYIKRYSIYPNKIMIRRQQTKWGSCSDKKNISLNLKLVCLPDEVIKYVIFHEMIHLKYRRHNQIFWQVISQEFPSYKEQEQKLLEYWFATEMFFKNLEKLDK
jgi:predicted metal-dependent hydrolase